MPIRSNLLSWQFNGYAANHQNRVNIAIHILTVPLFWSALLQFGIAAAQASSRHALLALALLGVPLLAQGIGHRMEKERPEPFLGGLDFFSRFFVEQTITFPRWLLTGGSRK